MKKKKITKKKTANNKQMWFKLISPRHEWGFVPINWKGLVAMILLIGINVFSAFYFNLRILVFDSWSKFGVVFFSSLFIFIMISKRKTKNDKKK